MSMENTSFVESKTTATIVRRTFVKETENHVFTISGVESDSPSRIRGRITHKNGTPCGDFTVTDTPRRMLNVNLSMDCKELLADLLVMIDDIDNNRIVEVDEFSYIKNSTTSQEISYAESETV